MMMVVGHHQEIGHHQARAGIVPHHQIQIKIVSQKKVVMVQEDTEDTNPKFSLQRQL
jgi:hypothetical protein